MQNFSIHHIFISDNGPIFPSDQVLREQNNFVFNQKVSHFRKKDILVAEKM